MDGQTESRWWRGTNRRLWEASPWSCTLKRSPHSTTTSWGSSSAPTPATHGFQSSGSTGFSAAFPDTRKRTWIMHETAQVAKQLVKQLWCFPAVSLLCLVFFFIPGFHFYASVHICLSFSTVQMRSMPKGWCQKGPTNWNTLFKYELDCQRVKFSLSQSSNTYFFLYCSFLWHLALQRMMI